MCFGGCLGIGLSWVVLLWCCGGCVVDADGGVDGVDGVDDGVDAWGVKVVVGL